jgi:hypothetical protein
LVATTRSGKLLINLIHLFETKFFRVVAGLMAAETLFRLIRSKMDLPMTSYILEMQELDA